jgi:ribA/ribD-fused uncharacterized protein
LIFNGSSYQTAEHLYQSLKFRHPTASDASLEFAEIIQTASTPTIAFELGGQNCMKKGGPWRQKLNLEIKKYLLRGVRPRSDWDDVRDSIMEEVLRLKFEQDLSCRAALIATFPKRLVEHTSRDCHWGDGGDGSGKNMLGQLLERVRLPYIASISSIQLFTEIVSDGTIRLNVLPINSGIIPPKRVIGHSNSVQTLVMVGPHLLASSSWDQTVRIWDLRHGDTIAILTGHQASVSSLAFCSELGILVSGSADTTIRLWQIEALPNQSPPLLAVLPAHDDSVMTLSSHGHRAASGSNDTTVKIWALPDGRCEQTLARHKFGVLATCFSPDGSLRLSGGRDCRVLVWSCLDWRLLQDCGAGVHEGPIRALVFHPTQEGFLSGAHDGRLVFWPARPASGAADGVVEGPFQPGQIISQRFRWVTCLAASGKRLAVGNQDGCIMLLSAAAGEGFALVHESTLHHSGLLDVALTDHFLASSSPDQGVRIWRLDPVPHLHHHLQRLQYPIVQWQNMPRSLLVEGMSVNQTIGLSGAVTRLLQQSSERHARLLG